LVGRAVRRHRPPDDPSEYHDEKNSVPSTTSVL
jgi:hypothetical protein